ARVAQQYTTSRRRGRPAANSSSTGAITSSMWRTSGRAAFGRRGRGRRCGPAAHVELENAGGQPDRVRPSAGLVHGEADGPVAIDEEASAQTALVLDDPMAATVSADQEDIRRRAVLRRGKLGLPGLGHGNDSRATHVDSVSDEEGHIVVVLRPEP